MPNEGGSDLERGGYAMGGWGSVALLVGDGRWWWIERFVVKTGDFCAVRYFFMVECAEGAGCATVDRGGFRENE